MKPFYERNGIIIYCGECSKVLAQFPDLHFNLTVTSPPYDALREYRGYVFDFSTISSRLWRVTNKGCVVVWVVADQTKDGSESGTSFRQALGFMELGFRLHDTMIYRRIGPPTVAVIQKRYEQHFEYMFVLSKQKPATCNHILVPKSSMNTGNSQQGQRTSNGSKTRYKPSKKNSRIKGNIWRYNVGGTNTKTNHPAVFPEALARDHILSWSNPGDLVLDPMAGSGTVGKMALELGRRCVLIDISEEYCKIAVERLRQPSFWSLPVEQKAEQKQERLL